MQVKRSYRLTTLLSLCIYVTLPLAIEAEHKIDYTEHVGNVDTNVVIDPYNLVHHVFYDFFIPFDAMNALDEVEREIMTKYIVKTCAYNTQLRATVHKYSGESHLLFFLKLMRIKGNVHLLLLTNYDVKKNAFIDDISGDTSILFYRYYDKLFVSDNKLFSQELETRYTGEKKIIDLALLYLLDEVKENDQRIVPLLEANKSLYAGSEDKVRLHLVLAKYYTKSGELGNATEQLATAAEYLNKIKNTELEAEYKADVEIVKIMNLIRLTEPNPEAWKTTSASTPVSACEKECERMLKSGELKAGVTLQDCMKIVCK